jgi:hypothetical protein
MAWSEEAGNVVRRTGSRETLEYLGFGDMSYLMHMRLGRFTRAAAAVSFVSKYKSGH